MTPSSGLPLRLAVDLRHLPRDGGPGAGVEHASIELVQALRPLAADAGIDLVPLYEPKGAFGFSTAVRMKRAHAVLVPSGSVPPFLRKPFYPWVHDVAIFRHPEWFPQHPAKRGLTTRLFLRGVRHARHVFAVSEDTKRALMEIAHIPSDRITVTYQAIHQIRSSAQPQSITRPYALIMGTVEPRKNIHPIVQLWPRIVESMSAPLTLVIAGRPGWGTVNDQIIREFGDAPWLVRLNDVSDRERDALVQHATMLLVPSLHEGFGRTALEGLSAGVPVIASNGGALPEILGDAGVLLDPNDDDGWISAIRETYARPHDPRPGYSRAALFTWQKTATIMLAKIMETW